MRILIIIVTLLTASSVYAEVCFDDAIAGRMVVELEQCRMQKDNADVLQQTITNLEEQIKIQDEMLEVYRDSLTKAKESIEGHKRLLDEQKGLYETEIKKARPGLIEQAIKALGFIGIGVLAGLLL